MKPAARPSRQLIPSPWRGTSSEEDARHDLQARIAVLFKLMFWSLVALLGFVWGQYLVYAEIAPEHRRVVYAGSCVGLAAMAFIWRVLLVRRKLSIATLYRIDLIYCVGIGASFGASAYLQTDVRPSAYMSVAYSAFTVFARALIVPSSARRTAVASALTFLPMTAAALAVAMTTVEELPPTAFFLGFLLLSIVAIVLSTVGSYIIYDLRRQVSAAQQLGQYTLDRKIGEGGMGAVYRAHHIMLRRPTAVKLLLPDRIGADNLERFEREVQHMSQLTHPNTVAVFDYGRSPDGRFYYAMEYLGGGIDLEKLVQRHGPQPSGRVARILAQVCGALQEAHDRGIIHRDIKPANIILCERGGMPDVAKVVDFGLVKEIAAEAGASTQVILGTPAYVAPEAVTDPANIGTAVDLYALGCVGYYLLTGRRVFDGKSAVEICIQHVTGTPAPLSQHVADIAPELELAIMTCLAKRPADRPASANELASLLRAVPPTPGWDVPAAKLWWTQRRDAEADATAASSSPTITMTVDLGQRDGFPT